MGRAPPSSPRPGERVLDVCAAPGGKATAMAVVRCRGDRRRPAAAPRPASSRRCRSWLATPCRAPPFAAGDVFDQVLIDAPCSGLGALRRRADARWRITAGDVAELAALQRRIIDAAAPLGAPRGVVGVQRVHVDRRGVDRPPGARSGSRPIDGAAGARWRPYGHGWRVLPHDHDTDGMVVIRYRRSS